MNLTQITPFLSVAILVVAGLASAQDRGGPEACSCQADTTTTVPAFNITNFIWSWNAADNTDFDSFDAAFWPEAPSARCAFSVSASTGYPVSVEPSSTICLIDDPENTHGLDMTTKTHLVASSTVGFQLIVPSNTIADPSLVFTMKIWERWICSESICAECVHWGEHSMTIDQFVWNGKGRKYVGPKDFCVVGYFSHD